MGQKQKMEETSMKKTLDWNKYLEVAAKTVAEGIVMLKNDNNALPLNKSDEVAVFGRIQLNYYKSGTGSGGMVNVSKVTGIVDGLLESGVKINKELLDVYKKWDSENPFDPGEGWGLEPWSQKEMKLDTELVKKIAKTSKTAIVIIGRTAGEEQDNHLGEGSFLLTTDEKDMLLKVRAVFDKVVVLLNVGNIIDMNFVDECNPDAVLYVWQGGMTGGTGTAMVLTGEISPCGKLTDTIANTISDCSYYNNFGDLERNFYKEDIYVGYRYFETFAKEKVKYPFGYGMSYTTFVTEVVSASADIAKKTISFEIKVLNTGAYKGKEVVQIYCEAPQGKLGKSSRVLCGYKKTSELKPGEEEILEIETRFSDISSYDDSGVTGHQYCTVLEAGEYVFYAGTDVRSAYEVYRYTIDDTLVLEEHTQALAPVLPFERIKPVYEDGRIAVSKEAVPLSRVDEAARRERFMPEEIKQTGDKGITLADVVNGKADMNRFIAQMTDEDLAAIVRGEGMNSPKVTAGTASAFGGVTDHLNQLGIPCGCCADGPSGMRLDCGTKAFSLPNGTMIASTYNDELVKELFELVGLEMANNKVDCLLGPGINIHRHPLNGRNFEYFSEDPYITGKMAVAELKGMHTAGVTGTIKHFCGNNQEKNRRFTDSVISERAVREIYLKGFEMAVKEAEADSIMTTYGSVNGLWTAGSYDLTTVILRNEWKFDGIVMSDWWAAINERGKKEDETNLAAMVRAQNDLYMVCADVENHDDNIMQCLEDGSLKRSELQRNATNICRFLMKTNAMKRIMDMDICVDIINKPETDNDIDDTDVKCYPIEEELTISLKDVCTDKGNNFSFSTDLQNIGWYEIIITASSNQSEVAQIPVTLFSNGTVYGTFTWNGTGGKPVSFTKKIFMGSRFTMLRFYFAQSGLDMESVTLKYLGAVNKDE